MEEESMAALTLSTNNNHIGGPKNGILPGERYQYFAFPDAIMYYIAMNPSNAHVYKKLIQTCKYFFNKNPILVVRSLEKEYCNIDDSANEWKVLIKESSNNSTQKETSGYLYDATNVIIDMDKLPCKLWVTQYILKDQLTFVCTKIGTPIIPKLYRSDADIVYLIFQILTLDEFLFLASNASKCVLWENKITENDGKDEVAFEKVIEKLTKLREIQWENSYPCEYFSSDTVKELIKLPHFANVSTLVIRSNSNEKFDAKGLFDYVKTRNKNMKVKLAFFIKESSAKFKKQIEEIVDEIIGTEVFTYMPPVIYDYYVIDDGKRNKMEAISGRYADTRF